MKIMLTMYNVNNVYWSHIFEILFYEGYAGETKRQSFMTKNKLQRMDNIGIVVSDLKAAIDFFIELGLELAGEMTAEGQWVDRIVGLKDVRNNIAMMRTPDGHGRLELMKFQHPIAFAGDMNAPVNTLGIRRIMFAVNNIDDVSARLKKCGAELVGEMVQYEDLYRLCYLRGPDGIIIALAEEFSNKTNTDPGNSKKYVLPRMDNVLIVVDDLEATRLFFSELGLVSEGETVVEGASVDRLIGLKNVRATLSLMRTPDGHSGIELDKFHSPNAVGFGSMEIPVNTLGIRRLMFAVENIDDAVERLLPHGATLIGEVVQYEDSYRLCYIRGPEGIIIALAEELK
jgi:catechol 2,3-dioxygenase-like lactoylglutathione lyase family enzyme